MLFNSIDFAIFLPIIYVLYWFLLKDHIKLQNILILIASYIFYAWWDYRFLSLIFLSTIVDFLIGLKIHRQQNVAKRKILLWLSIIVNLSILGFFKYSNFFLENLNNIFSFFGSKIKSDTLNIILPIGISFYTFQTLSYCIDIYYRKIEPTKDIIAFAAFVSFFPQLVAGPIERATNLLPQFNKNRIFDYSKSVDGMRQILWGLFKKIVIADNCAEYANLIFNNSDDYSGSTLVLGAILFAFQIYGDFSGYSDIAIGTSRLFGFNLLPNFKFPYFSRDMAEFWRRWHISLSNWFRDYVYIPLGGSRGGTWSKVKNTFIIFILSGLWHGANFTFIIWGTLNALYFLPLLLTNNNRNNIEIIAKGKLLPSCKELFSVLLTFGLSIFSWIFFRAENIGHAIKYVTDIFSPSIFNLPYIIESNTGHAFLPKQLFLLIGIFIIIEWIGREQQFAIQKLGLKWKRPIRYVLYYAIATSLFWFGDHEQQFIYFQF